MYKPGQYLGKAVRGDDLSRREALPALGEGLAGLVAAFHAGSMISPSEASAQSKAHAAVPRRLTIDEYYQQARPADHIMPGAREQDYSFATVKTHGFAFFKREWADYYVKNMDGKGEKMRKLFHSIDGKELHTGTIFDFAKFDNYWINNADQCEEVAFTGQYIEWKLPKEGKRVAVPMDRSIMSEIEKLW